MNDRNRKSQLGVRVSARAREIAVAAAAEAKESLNEWVERAILALAGDIGPEPVVPHPDQIVLDVPVVRVGDMTGASSHSRPVSFTTFDPACRNRAYHWKQAPGNPCRFCGGEV